MFSRDKEKISLLLYLYLLKKKVSNTVVSNCFVSFFDVSSRPEQNLGQPGLLNPKLIVEENYSSFFIPVIVWRAIDSLPDGVTVFVFLFFFKQKTNKQKTFYHT